MEPISLPVLRRLIIPDPGMTLLDLDLSAADAQVVAWASGDTLLKQQLRSGTDLYMEEETGLWAECSHIPRGRRKNCVHSANYGASYRTIGDKYIGNRNVARRWLNRWFALHPSIRAWQRATEFSLNSNRTVTNPWGFRRIYTDRLDYLLPQALAWIGQSTVAITINKILLRVDHAHEHDNLPIQVLLQDHDNLVMQCPTNQLNEAVPRLLELAKVPIPFPNDPLVISASLKVSQKSWADVEPVFLHEFKHQELSVTILTG
jgi:DNA polymerase-1